jgi:hypothetical protein
MRMSSLIAVAGLAFGASECLADGVFKDTYPQTISFDASSANLAGGTSMNLTFDGNRYFSSAGGGPTGDLLATWDPAGFSLSGVYAPNLDFRSVFTLDGTGSTLYARQYADNTVYKMIRPGVFEPGVVLDGPLDEQSQVMFDSAGEAFIALSQGGLLQRWDLAGTSLASGTLDAWGSRFDEANYPQDRGVVAAAGYFLTYSNGNLSAWDTNGVRVGTTLLIDAGSSFDSHFSLSWANGMIWVIDVHNGLWRGYEIPELLAGCYPDCDASGTLNIDDFICFQTFFALSDPYADCDANGVLNIDDFICFQTFFAIGC